MEHLHYYYLDAFPLLRSHPLESLKFLRVPDGHAPDHEPGRDHLNRNRQNLDEIVRLLHHSDPKIIKRLIEEEGHVGIYEVVSWWHFVAQTSQLILEEEELYRLQEEVAQEDHGLHLVSHLEEIETGIIG